MAVLGTPSSSVSSRIFFMATMLPVDLCCALYTTPYVPVEGVGGVRWGGGVGGETMGRCNGRGR